MCRLTATTTQSLLLEVKRQQMRRHLLLPLMVSQPHLRRLHLRSLPERAIRPSQTTRKPPSARETKHLRLACPQVAGMNEPLQRVVRKRARELVCRRVRQTHLWPAPEAHSGSLLIVAKRLLPWHIAVQTARDPTIRNTHGGIHELVRIVRGSSPEIS